MLDLWNISNSLPYNELRLRLTLRLGHIVIATVWVFTLMMVLWLARVLVHLLLHVLICHLLLSLYLLFHALSIKLLLDVLIWRWLEFLVEMLLRAIRIVVDSNRSVRTLIHISLVNRLHLFLLRVEEICAWLLLLLSKMLLLHLLLLLSLLLNLGWYHHVLEIHLVLCLLLFTTARRYHCRHWLDKRIVDHFKLLLI